MSDLKEHPSEGASSASGPLAGLRILDIGHLIAGPFAATLLGDFGADVIKVERTGHGDVMREFGPRIDATPIWWKSLARNKRSIQVDWTTEDGRAVMLRLVESADVLVENFRPGTLERHGLGPEKLLGLNPYLVILRVSGYGQVGPYREQPGFGKTAEAFSGLVHLTGERDGPPMHVSLPIGDLTTGLMGAYGVLLALLGRERGMAKGQVIDLPIYETMLRLIDFHIPIYSATGSMVMRSGSQQPMALGCSGIFAASDGKWISFTAGTLSVARSVLNLVGDETYAADPRFADMQGVSANANEISNRVRAWMAAHTSAEVLRLFAEADAVASLVQDPSDIVADPHVRARENVVRVPGSSFDVVGIVPRLSATPGKIRWLGPDAPGEHTSEILDSLEGEQRPHQLHNVSTEKEKRNGIVDERKK